MEKYRLFIVFQLFSFILSINLFAQDKGIKKTYTLDECLKLARENNPQVKIAESQLSLAGAEITSAFGNYLPSASFNAGYTRQLNVETGQKINIGGQTIVVGKVEPNSYNMSLSLSYNIFDGFAREAQYSSVKDNLNFAYSKYSQTLQEVEINIYRSFVNVLRNKKLLESRKQDLELAKKELERTNAKYLAGSIPYSNVLAQEAEVANKEIYLIQAENDLKSSKISLTIAMGLNRDLDFDVEERDINLNLTEEEIQKFKSELGNPEALIQSTFSKRHDYQAMEQQIASSRANITIARAGYLPTLSAYGGWSWANNEFRNFSELGRSFVGLALRIPIFENFKANYQIELAKTQLVQLEMQKFQLEQNIRNQIIQALNNLEAAEKQFLAVKKSLVASEKNFENIGERYRVGATGIVEYIYANNLLINAKINYINSVYNYYIAQKEVLFYTGNLQISK